MFICTGITPSVAVDTVKKPSIPISNGTTLYVGGTGPNNYTSIQDAIDNASKGDTVFVYAYSSPYYENVIIDKSINLIGENKNTTIIDGGGKENVVWIKDYIDGVTISGFTIQKCGNNSDEFYTNSGMYISSSYNIIFDNNIVDNNGFGISIWLDGEWTYNNIINRNIIKNNIYGIGLVDSVDSKIFDNYIANKAFGIYSTPQYFPIKGASYLSFQYWENEIYRNTFTNNDVGIYQFDWGGDNIYENKIINNGHGIYMDNMYGLGGYNNVFNNSIMENNVGICMMAMGGGSTNSNIYRNNIISNRIGIDIVHAWFTEGANDNKIYQNNFIGNLRFNVRDKCKNHYDANYWDNWIGFKINWPIFQRFPKIIFGKGLFDLIPSFNFDWHPAKEPYDIGV